MENTSNTTNGTTVTEVESKETKVNPEEFIDLADKTYLEFVKNGRYKDILENMSNLGTYSLRNQMLILSQMPTAKKVNSMNSWNFNKRSIIKGSKSIKILAPVFDSTITVENGQVIEKKSDYATGYNINSVFDISQTTAKDSQSEAAPQLESYEPYYNDISNALINTLKSYEVKVADIPSDGVLDTRERTITLKNGLSKENFLKTIIDQVAAALVLGRDRSKFKGLKSDTLSNLTAVEITAVSNVVAKKFGLEPNRVVEPEFDKMQESDIVKFSENLGLSQVRTSLNTPLSESFQRLPLSNCLLIAISISFAI